MSHGPSPCGQHGQRENRPISSNLSVKCHATLVVIAGPRYLSEMEIESIRHKGLRRFFESGNAKGLVGDVGRLRKVLAFIDAVEGIEELSVPPNYGCMS